MHSRWFKFLAVLIFIQNVASDSFKFNTFNNHGSVGLINTPTARFFDESSFGFVAYDGSPDQKLTMTAYPYDWFEASVFYTNIQGKPYPNFESYQDYKDKGFNFKIRIKEEDRLPAIAVGINDVAGTGFYSSEYIVSSYGINNIDFHLGIGWGALNGFDDFNNPFKYIDERFESRPIYKNEPGGSIDFDRYFSGRKSSSFFGISYVMNDKTILKLERDPTLTPGLVGYENSDSDLSLSIEFNPRTNWTFGLSYERNNFLSMRFSYKDKSNKGSNYRYKKSENAKSSNKYTNLRRNLNANGIGVNKIYKKDNKIGIEVTQFSFQSLDILEEVIMTAKIDSNISEELSTNYKIADLDVAKAYDINFINESELIYEKKKTRNFSSDTRVNIRPFLAGREGFLKVGVLLENDSEYVISDNFFFSSNLKYSLWDNYDDLIFPPVDTYPEQVRSDVKDYLKGFSDGIVVGRAQFDYFKTISKNNHIMLTAGILEEMFSGAGFEYLWFDKEKDYAFGVEVFDVVKRDYKLRFGNLDYENTTAHLNFYYRNYRGIPFDLKLSYGEYLAGDVGSTIELSRQFKSGINFGVFASKTNVTSEQFGEGSFDKGIFFNIPIFGNGISYQWRPLTKDPGQKLIRKNNLHDLLVKFKPIN